MKPFNYLLSMLMLIVLAGCNLGAQPANLEQTLPIETAAEPIIDTTEDDTEAEATEAVIDDVAIEDSASDETSIDFSTADTEKGPNDGASAQSNTVQQPAILPPRVANVTTTCSPQASWPIYAVVRGDTLYSIAQRSGATVAVLTQANCLSDANSLSVGQTLYVPRYPDVVDNTPTTNDPAPCLITTTQRTPVVNAPSGTGRTTIGYLAAGSTLTPVLHFDGLPYWAVMFNGGMGWIDVQPTGDCSNVARNAADVDIMMGDGDGADPATCMATLTMQTAVANTPSGTGRTNLGFLGAGTTVEIVLSSGGLPFWGIWYNGVIGWIDVDPIGPCDALPTSLDTDGSDIFNGGSNVCQITPTQPIAVYNTPVDAYQQQTLPPQQYLVVATSPGGWVKIVHDVHPTRRSWTQATPQGDCSAVPQEIFDCQFVAQRSAPIYTHPNVRAEITRNTTIGEHFRFAAFSGTWEDWTSDGEIATGRWVEVFVSFAPPTSGYIQAETGRLDGHCPS